MYLIHGSAGTEPVNNQIIRRLFEKAGILYRLGELKPINSLVFRQLASRDKETEGLVFVYFNDDSFNTKELARKVVRDNYAPLNSNFRKPALFIVVYDGRAAFLSKVYTAADKLQCDEIAHFPFWD